MDSVLPANTVGNQPFSSSRLNLWRISIRHSKINQLRCVSLLLEMFYFLETNKIETLLT
jgi:hypothetical protein